HVRIDEVGVREEDLDLRRREVRGFVAARAADARAAASARIPATRAACARHAAGPRVTACEQEEERHEEEPAHACPLEDAVPGTCRLARPPISRRGGTLHQG